MAAVLDERLDGVLADDAEGGARLRDVGLVGRQRALLDDLVRELLQGRHRRRGAAAAAAVAQAEGRLHAV